MCGTEIVYKFNCDGRLESLPKRLVRVKDLERTRTQHGSQGKITREISLLKELLNLKDAISTRCLIRDSMWSQGRGSKITNLFVAIVTFSQPTTTTTTTNSDQERIGEYTHRHRPPSSSNDSSKFSLSRFIPLPTQ